ncbi:MAG: hypothetical protein H6893_03060 [Brucellaceae bacterium]|nr:hypothetical protein [Brucellaceae bacterium]
MESLMSRAIPAGAILGAIAVTTLIGTEIVSVLAAAVWAVTGLLHLGPATTFVLAIAAGLPGLVSVGLLAILAINAEVDLQES